MNQESLYLKLPIYLQNLACSIEGWRIQRTRFNRSFLDTLQKVESRARWSSDQIHSYRNERLVAFIYHCYNTVPFYNKRFKELHLHPEDFSSLDDLPKLPIMTKQEVQDNYCDLVSSAIPKYQHIVAHTSGTTGGGLRFATTMVSIQEQWAVWSRYRRWHGVQLDTWCGYFGGRSIVPLAQINPPFWRYNYPGKQIFFSAYHMSPSNLDAYASELSRKQPSWLHGYPSLLALLASHIIEKNIHLGYRIQCVSIGAENLLPHQAELIEKAFGVRPKQHYGMAEAIANFSECEYGRLHVDEDFSATEFIPDLSGSGCKIIGTNFTNLATPLLRYDVQDLATVVDEVCPCGRTGRIVGCVDGRVEDYVILKSGARLGRMDHVFKDLVNIREAQIHQKDPGKITVRVVRGEHFGDQDELRLFQEMRKRVGEDTEVNINYVKQLERSRTGKLRFVVSELKNAQIRLNTSE